jgi:hypothetical protein
MSECQGQDPLLPLARDPRVRDRQELAQQAAETSPGAGVVCDIGIAIHCQPEVRRSEGSPNLYLTFRELSDARSSVDRDTRLP